MNNSRRHRPQKACKTSRAKYRSLPRFKEPFVADVFVWREISSADLGGVVRCNVIRTCTQRPPGEYDCGNSGPGSSELALNILNAFLPPRPVAVRRWGESQRDDDPLKTSKGVASRFAIEHHQAFKVEFIAALPKDGGRISAERIREWIALRQRLVTPK